MGDLGEITHDRVVGEVQLTGSSLLSEYFHDPESTREKFSGHWLRTGDLGFMLAGQLYISGRIKETIIVGGRNIYPDDIEVACARVANTDPGHLAAFAVERGSTTEQIAVVIECRPNHDACGITAAVREACFAETGVVPDVVVCVRTGTIPRTTSGKKRRLQLRDMFLEGRLGSELVHARMPASMD
jgi:fatty-acyl-CoA synthase